MSGSAKRKRESRRSSRSPSHAQPATSKPSLVAVGPAVTLPYRALYGGPPLVPAIAMLIHAPRGRFNVTALIDSGADNSMFPMPWAQHFGIDIGDCEETDCNTVGGPTKQYSWPDGFDAEIQTIGRRVHLTARFADGLPVVLVGRHDFFATFKTTFDERAQTFTLEPYE